MWIDNCWWKIIKILKNHYYTSVIRKILVVQKWFSARKTKNSLLRLILLFHYLQITLYRIYWISHFRLLYPALKALSKIKTSRVTSNFIYYSRSYIQRNIENCINKLSKDINCLNTKLIRELQKHTENFAHSKKSIETIAI